MNTVRTLLFLSALFLVSAVNLAALSLPAFFSDRMVMQADRPVALWGWAEPGAEVRVRMLDRVTSARADEETGRWQAALPPLPAGGPYQVRVESGEKAIVIDDVLVGEVWLASGQSNMEWTMRRLGIAPEETAAADYPALRIFTAERVYSEVPLEDLAGEWKVCHPDNAGDLSAVGYYFGRDLHLALETPVGLIVSSYGGSTAEAWMSEESLRAEPAFAPIFERLAAWQEGYPAAEEAFSQRLAGWQEAVAAAREAGETPPRRPGTPATVQRHKWALGLRNGMIAPLVPYPVRGVIWYQGESNTDRAEQYERLFPALIADWRKQWGQEDLPFLFVQLANYRARLDAPAESGWAELREAQRKSLAVPHTAMAVAIDIGEAGDIHPKNKWDVGDRLARAALATAYGRDLAYSGPDFRAMTISGDRVRVAFDHVYGGLRIHGERLEGFSLAGADRQFHWAEAVIEGEEVVLHSPLVPEPVAVRYGWADNPACNLYNSEGLPASPFRTDDWPGLTTGLR